jgi:predicted unusual protein kinase regulating ubiquinone biosynthesis (AarF/ABC1/UbiB family)
VGEEAAEAMKVLQKDNRAFSNRVAYNQILADLDWEGPLAPGFPAAMANDGPPLFASFEPEPVAAASLGQVRERERGRECVCERIRRLV